MYWGLYPYEYISSFEKFKGRVTSNEKFYSLLTGKKEVWLCT